MLVSRSVARHRVDSFDVDVGQTIVLMTMCTAFLPRRNISMFTRKAPSRRSWHAKRDEGAKNELLLCDTVARHLGERRRGEGVERLVRPIYKRLLAPLDGSVHTKTHTHKYTHTNTHTHTHTRIQG